MLMLYLFAYLLNRFVITFICFTFVLRWYNNYCILFQAIHLIAIWENLLPSTPKFIMSYFRRREFLVAAACGVSFLLSISYAIQVSQIKYSKVSVLDIFFEEIMLFIVIVDFTYFTDMVDIYQFDRSFKVQHYSFVLQSYNNDDEIKA